MASRSASPEAMALHMNMHMHKDRVMKRGAIGMNMNTAYAAMPTCMAPWSANAMPVHVI
jgi:hypothetical protein